MEKNTHYYSKNVDNVESNPQTFDFNYKNNHFVFKTDNGVFSKDYIDYGSFVMLNNFIPNDIDLPILDMGSGYGAISIVLSKLLNKKFVGVEINERAYNLAIENANKNNVDVDFYNGSIYEPIEELKFSSIITNPPIRAGKEVVYGIFDGAYDHLVAGGELWVVIQKKQGAPSAKDHLTEKFGNCEVIKRDRGYYILKSVKK